jgi:hypothetical protein
MFSTHSPCSYVGMCTATSTRLWRPNCMPSHQKVHITNLNTPETMWAALVKACMQAAVEGARCRAPFYLPWLARQNYCRCVHACAGFSCVVKCMCTHACKQQWRARAFWGSLWPPVLSTAIHCRRCMRACVQWLLCLVKCMCTHACKQQWRALAAKLPSIPPVISTAKRCWCVHACAGFVRRVGQNHTHKRVHRGNYHINRVGQNHIYTVYIRYFWQGHHKIYGHIRCIYTVLANPIYIPSCTVYIYGVHIRYVYGVHIRFWPTVFLRILDRIKVHTLSLLLIILARVL